MDNKKYAELLKKVLTEVIDFKSGVIQEIDTEKQENGCVLDVKWKRNVHFILHIIERDRSSWYYVEKMGSKSYVVIGV